MFLHQALDFGINALAGLTCLAVAWLYFDAWSGRKSRPVLMCTIGFVTLAMGFIISPTISDSDALSDLPYWLRLAGYGAIILGQIASPLQRTPTQSVSASQRRGQPSTLNLAMLPLPQLPNLSAITPLAALLVAALYWRRATRGLERHLKPLAIAFSILSAAELTIYLRQWQAHSTPLLQSLSAPLGALWILQNILLLAGAAGLAIWVERYLTKRLLSQLFLSITSLGFIIVVASTVTLAGILIKQIERSELTNLHTAGNVLAYAIDAQANKTRADAQILVAQPTIASAILDSDHVSLASSVTKLSADQALSEVIVLNSTGAVLARSSDPERFGDSYSSEHIVNQALQGRIVSSLKDKQGALNPTVSLTTASPVEHNGTVIGAVLTSLNLDRAFVERLKSKTGLEATIYAGTIRTSTTLSIGDVGRPEGTRETNAAVIQEVIEQGHTWQGSVSLLGEPYLGAYLPLKDTNDSAIGMLMIAKSQSSVQQSITTAINLVFAYAAASLILLVPITYYLARRISRQLN